MTPPKEFRLFPGAKEKEKPARSTGGGTTVPCSFRVPAVMKAAALDLCDRMPQRFQCANDVYIAGLRLVLEQAVTGPDDPVLVSLAACKTVGEFERMEATVVEGVQRTVEAIKVAVARGMTEKAHELYGTQMDAFAGCRDPEFRRVAMRQMELEGKPLLPKRNAVNLRVVSKVAIIYDK